MPDLSLTLQTNPVLFGFIALIITLVSYFIYRITVPPIPGALKATLIFLRSAGLIAVLMIFFEPVLTVVTRSETPPRVIVMIDDSRSMQLVDGEGDRAETVEQVLNNDLFSTLQRQNKLTVIRFAGEADMLTDFSPDTFQLQGPATNIDAAIKKVREIRESENISLGILISDGNYNTGPRPIYEAEQIGIPIYTVGIGDSLEQKDVLISRVLANEIAYLDTESPVDVRVRSTGYAGERVAVTLSDENRVIGEETITLIEGTADYEISFSFQPEDEGTKRLTVRVEELPGEVTYENNLQSFFVRIIDRRMRVLVLAGSPSQDVVFLRRTLESDETVDVSLSVQGIDGSFIGDEPADQRLREADLIILAGFPTSDSPSGLVNMVREIIEQQNKPLFFMESSHTDARRIDSVLPVVTERTMPNERQTFVHVPDEFTPHSIFRAGDEHMDVAWHTLPPIFRTMNRYSVRPGSEIIMTHRMQNIPLDDPFLVLRSVGGSKSAAMLGYGVWRWRMMGRGPINGEQIFDNLIINLVQWLTTEEDQDRVRITSSKEQYHTGESIEFAGQVYDEQYRPLPNADIRVAVRSENQTFETILSPRGHGRYEGRLNPLPEGNYVYEGIAQYEGIDIGKDEGQFMVGELNLEFRDTRMNVGVMRQIAAVSGGSYIHSNEQDKLGEILRKIDSHVPRIETQSADFQIWSLPAALIMMILFFSIEWFLRKRNGML
jgi:hypothetical protein